MLTSEGLPGPSLVEGEVAAARAAACCVASILAIVVAPGFSNVDSTGSAIPPNSSTKTAGFGGR